MAKIDTSETTKDGDKVARYGWKMVGTCGELSWVPKRDIKTDYDAYQRDPTEKVEAICRNLNWMAFGCLTLARRPDRSLWVVDGNNRLHACLRRSDVKDVPCIIFDVEKLEDEAAGFLGANKMRKPVSALETFRAMKTSGSPEHAIIEKLLGELGMSVSQDTDNINAVKCVSQLLAVVKKHGEDGARAVFRAVHALLGGKSRWMKSHVQGMHWLHNRLDCERGVANETFLLHCREADIARLTKAMSLSTMDHPEAHAGKAILYAVNYGRRKVLFGEKLLGK